MDRLTFEGNFCDISMCRENPCPYNGMCSQRQTWERLKEYEETGLKPEDMGHWMDWFRAECEGRMVVLPCKVGDRVWVTRAYGKPFDAPREGHVRKFVVHDDELVFLEALIWMDLGEGKNEYGYRTESFGKIVHLTREEAEAALAQEGGNDRA